MHVPVMLSEIIRFLDIKSDGVYIDATFGCGGHSNEILKYLNTSGRLFVLDKDVLSYNFAKECYFDDTRVKTFCMSYSNISSILNKCSVLHEVDGIIADLGLSFVQYKDFNKGFGFDTNGFLDMRLDIAQNLRAIDWLNHASFYDLESVFFFLGNANIAKRIAQNIVRFRKTFIIRTSHDLYSLILNIDDMHCSNGFFNKIFQAIRIFINDDLHNLNVFLHEVFILLKPNAFLIIITFNSLEDKIVKSFFLKKNVTCMFIKPSLIEVSNNLSSRSAVMRIFKRK